MEMPIEEKLEACRDFRRKGNLFHEEGQYRRAALQYRQVLVYSCSGPSIVPVES